MYLPVKNRVDDPSVHWKFIESYPFGTMLTEEEGQIETAHLPFLPDFCKESQKKILVCHTARANQIWRHANNRKPVKVLFQGPHAYISPRWFQPKSDNVPTWNYCVVHVTGSMEIVRDENFAFENMQRLVAHFDPTWQLALTPEDRKSLLNEIVIMKIFPSEIVAKFKLSQNTDQNDRNNVIKELSQSSQENDRRIAEYMQKF